MAGDDHDRPAELKTPFLFVVGFIVVFVIGGLSGVMFAVIPFDQQVTDSYFVVAHFHYVLFGGAVFPIFAGLYYWLPKMSGRLLQRAARAAELLARLRRASTSPSSRCTSPACSGCRGASTPIPPAQGWGMLNLLSTIGAFVLAARHPR